LYEADNSAVRTFQKGYEGIDGTSTGKDYRNISTLYVWRKLAHPGWIVVGKIDQAEADGQANSLIKIFVYAGLCVVAVATLLSRTASGCARRR
jgi:hypothetical protein